MLRGISLQLLATQVAVLSFEKCITNAEKILTQDTVTLTRVERAQRLLHTVQEYPDVKENAASLQKVGELLDKLQKMQACFTRFMELENLSKEIFLLAAIENKQHLSYDDLRSIFSVLLQLFYPRCIGLYELNPHDPLSAEKFRLIKQGNRFIADYPEPVLRQYFERIMKLTRDALPEAIYEKVGHATTLLQEMKVQEEQPKTLTVPLIALEAKLVKITGPLIGCRKKQLDDSLYSQWPNLKTPEQKTLVLRQVIEAENELIEKWALFLNKQSKFLVLKRLDLSGVDLSELNLTHVQFEGTKIEQANLSNVQAEVEQFVFVFGVLSTKMDPDFLSAIQSAKYQYVCQCYGTEVELIKTQQNTIKEAIHGLDILQCNGEPPVLDNLDASTGVIALMSSYVNVLDSKHPYSIVTLNDKIHQQGESVVLANLSCEDIISAITQMLEAREYRLSAEIIAFVQQQKLSLIYEQLSSIRDEFELLERISQDLTQKQQAEVAQLSKEPKEIYNTLRLEKQNLLTHFQQKVINCFIDALFEEKNTDIGVGTEERLRWSLESARNQNHLIVDLTGVDLSQVPFNADIDFSNVHVKLTLEQDKQLPWKQQQQRYARLYRAVEEGNCEEIQICINQGLDINHKNQIGRTPLMTACVFRQVESIEFLLQAGADPNLKTEQGWQIIEAVARMGQEYRDVVQVLQQNGATLDFISAVYLGDCEDFFAQESLAEKINFADRTGVFPLHIAAERGYCELADWLITQGAQLNTPNRSKKTALHLAVEKGNSELVNLLIQRGAEVTLSILRATCEKQQTELARVLSEQIGEANFDLYTAMYLDKTQRVRAIVAGRYNEVIFEDYTPLTLACQLGKLDVVTWLIEKKADINLPAKRKTPLGHAIQGQHTPLVELLLEKGASPLSAFQHNAPALFLAVEAGYTDIVEIIVSFLIRHDAKFDLVVMPTLPKDLKAYSQPVYIFSEDKLFYAASTQKSCMRIQTVQNRVEELKVELNIPTLQAPEKMKRFPNALTHEDVAYLRGKIDEKVAWINRTYQGRTLLLVAAFHGYEKIVQTLLAAGASPYAKDIIGNTPLHLAAQGGHTGVCRHLSQAMLQPCNQQGATPEQLAAKQGHHNVKDLLSVFSPFSPVEPEVELIQSAASDEKKEDEKTHLQPSFH